jgi:hypothetical protein
LHPHVWYPNSGDVFTRNIVMGPYRPARMHNGRWGRKLDYNLFTSIETDRSAYLYHGADANSVMGDARFVDPAAGDFRVADGSPALGLGFQNFPIDTSGVIDPRLRSMTRTPDIPRLRNQLSDPAAIIYEWFWGCSIRNLEGGEYSAWGISSEIGGILVLHVPGWREAGAGGLKDGDLLYSCNEVAMKTVEDLIKVISEAPADQPLNLKVRREGKGGINLVIPERPLVPQQL